MTHERISNLAQVDGELAIGGIPLRQLVARVGSTPFYAYDRAHIRARVSTLRAALPRALKLHYAIKSNPMPALVQLLSALVDGFDVASHGEMLVALDTGMAAADIGFAGPGKRDFELRAAIAAQICLSVESPSELQRVARIARELGTRASVALRVNPAFELRQSGAKMGGHASQFGIDAERVAALLQGVDESVLEVRGLHIYAGSQNLDAAAIIEANRLTMELAARLAAASKREFEFVNIGGGYGIPYFATDISLDVGAVGSALAETMAANADFLRRTEVVIELGRYLVGEAGYYVTAVTDIKESQGETFAVVDGGLHHHLANSGNFGQVIRKNFPVVVGNKLDATAGARTVNVVGPLCTPLDIVASKLEVPGIEVGDFVVVLQSGAYGYSASPHRFLGHPVPAEVLV